MLVGVRSRGGGSVILVGFGIRVEVSLVWGFLEWVSGLRFLVWYPRRPSAAMLRLVLNAGLRVRVEGLGMLALRRHSRGVPTRV